MLRVSADARLDERTGLSWYEVELSMGAAIKADATTGIAAWPGRAMRTAAGLAARAERESGCGSTLPDSYRRNASTTWTATRRRTAGGRRHGTRAPAHARDLALAPGMPVEVLLRTGERSPLSYLAKPLTDYFTRSLREE